MADEDPDDFSLLRVELMKEWAPTGATELCLVERIAVIDYSADPLKPVGHLRSYFLFRSAEKINQGNAEAYLAQPKEWGGALIKEGEEGDALGETTLTNTLALHVDHTAHPRKVSAQTTA